MGTGQDNQADPDELGDEPAVGSEMPAMDFNILVLSLNTSALLHLGEAPEPESSAEVDLGMARHTIDMLTVLEQKTRGNLSGHEERLLHQVLFDLRMRYTAKAGGPKPR